MFKEKDKLINFLKMNKINLNYDNWKMLF